MSILIRRAQHGDAEGIIQSHVQSIRKLCSKDYTHEQIEAWAGRKFRAPLWHQAIDRDFVWVVEKDNSVMGFGHFAVMDEDNGELMGLYFRPEICGQGLAHKLFKEILKVATEHNLNRINLHATITARTFYENLGFVQSESDTTIEMQGVPIPCYPMQLSLR